jgi:hypothetical protein
LVLAVLDLLLILQEAELVVTQYLQLSHLSGGGGGGSFSATGAVYDGGAGGSGGGGAVNNAIVQEQVELVRQIKVMLAEVAETFA